MRPRRQSVIKNSIAYAAMVLGSGAMWVAIWLLNKYMMSFSSITPGIDLVYLPAGFRLLIILVFGVWGALGIFLFEPLLFFKEFANGTALQILATSTISAFSPLLVVSAFCRIAGIKRSMAGLKPFHLPILAFALSAITPFLFNVLFVVTGVNPASQFMRNYTAMATGDFLGCVLVIGLIKLAALLIASKRRR